jgi:hypothetical protein
MQSSLFDVVLGAGPREGVSAEQAAANLARLFKIDAARAAQLLVGGFVAKRGVDQATAEKYQQALEAAGARVQVVAQVVASPPTAEPAAVTPAPPEPAAVPASPAPAVASEGSGPLAGVDVAPPGSVIVPPETIAPPVFDLSGMDMAEPGVQLVEHAPVEAPDIDTAALSVGAVGEQLVEHAPVPTPEIATEHMSVAEPGETLDGRPPPPPVDIDTDELHLDP